MKHQFDEIKYILKVKKRKKKALGTLRGAKGLPSIVS